MERRSSCIQTRDWEEVKITDSWVPRVNQSHEEGEHPKLYRRKGKWQKEQHQLEEEKEQAKEHKELRGKQQQLEEGEDKQLEVQEEEDHMGGNGESWGRTREITGKRMMSSM